MLRCLQLTIHSAHGLLSCFPKSVLRDGIQLRTVEKPATLSSLTTGNSSCSAPVNERIRVLWKRRNDASDTSVRVPLLAGNSSSEHLLKQYLKDPRPNAVAPQELVTLFNDSRATCLTPKQMSGLISIFGTLSLPPDAPRVKNRHVEAMGSCPRTSYWELVRSLVVDKESLGCALSDGDRYWLMWIRLVDIKSMDEDTDPQVLFEALEDATYQFRQIWRQTKNPDLLAPFFDVFLSLPTHQYHSLGLELLSDLLAFHRDIHPGLIHIIWRFLLLDPETLSLSSKEKFFSVLQDRAKVHPHPTPGSRSLSTHMFNPLTRRHERHALDTRQLVAFMTAPLFPVFYIPGPSPVVQWATSLLRASLSSELPINSRWRNLSLLAFCHSCTRGDSQVSPPWQHPSSLGEWDVILILRSFEHTMLKDLPDCKLDTVRALLSSLWHQWKEIPNDGRPTFVTRAFVTACLRLAGRIGDLDVCIDGWRYCAQHGLLLPENVRTEAERIQVEHLTKEYVEAFLSIDGNCVSYVLQSLNSSPRPTFAANVNATLVAFIPHDITISYDLYTYCVQRGITIVPQSEERLVMELARFLPSAAMPFLKKYEGRLRMLESMLTNLLRVLWTERRQYIDPKHGSLLAGAMVKLFQAKAPSRTLRFPIGHTALLLIPHSAERVVHVLESILQTNPAYFTRRFLHRLLRVFIQHRFYRLAVRLHSAIRTAMPHEMRHSRRILCFGLVRGGSTTLARGLRTRDIRKHLFLPWRSVRSPSRQVNPSRPSFYLRLKRIANALASRRNVPIYIRRFLLMYSPYLSTPTKTLLGNLLLDLLISRFSSTGRPIQRLTRLKRFLFRRISFIGDRVTLNIFVKAFLKSHTSNAFEIRILFDYLVRSGYPAPTHWKRSYGVPFGTPLSTPPPFDLSFPETRPISFERHTRPLYKMFVKAFHLRNDIAGAKTVIGILQAAEVAFLTAKSSAKTSRRKNL
ncbi:hypothetical protein L218DRAFT_1073744 [Marasmius fiardii PR-910]|nr:hypothetical protein L218DRAFT_1073744 [Marasmius fiardii PR-910]